jgi:mono/diheme cytochrome c family protein
VILSWGPEHDGYKRASSPLTEVVSRLSEFNGLGAAKGNCMFHRVLVPILALSLILGVAAAQNPPEIKKVPVTQTSPTSGKEMFTTYCAVCHGKDGKGGGPAAAALKKAPADLTTLSARNNGNFPAVKVSRYIQGLDQVDAHGSRDMPMWGEMFRSLDKNNAAMLQMRVSNLTDFVKTLQAK